MIWGRERCRIMVVEVQVVEVMEGQVVEVQVEHVAHLGVVLEEVDLHGAVGEVHHHGPARPEPGLQGRDTGQLVLLTHLGGGVRRSEGRSEEWREERPPCWRQPSAGAPSCSSGSSSAASPEEEEAR